jgi:hypothetical protein
MGPVRPVLLLSRGDPQVRALEMAKAFLRSGLRTRKCPSGKGRLSWEMRLSEESREAELLALDPDCSKIGDLGTEAFSGLSFSYLL